MRGMWTVELTRRPERDDYREGFFPRTVAYRRDAEALLRELREKGGDGVVVRGGRARPQ